MNCKSLFTLDKNNSVSFWASGREMFVISFTCVEYLNDSLEWICHHYEWNYTKSTTKCCFPPPPHRQSSVSSDGNAEQRKKYLCNFFLFLISQKETMRDKCTEYWLSTLSGGSHVTYIFICQQNAHHFVEDSTTKTHLIRIFRAIPYFSTLWIYRYLLKGALWLSFKKA